MDKDLKRKLAAILVADVVGYSRLIADDEEATLRRLEVFRAVWQDCTVKYGGRIFNTAGDSVLAEFQSAVEAVRCALDFQAQAKAHNDGMVPNRQMHFRIGITIGDVVERGSDLLGDGVNIAARLQSLAGQGGICVSSWVREAVANKLSVKFTDMGDQSVKNIPTPIRAYAVASADSVSLTAGEPVAMQDWLGRAVSSWRSMSLLLGIALAGVIGLFLVVSNLRTSVTTPVASVSKSGGPPSSAPVSGTTKSAAPGAPQAPGAVREILRDIDTGSPAPRPPATTADKQETRKEEPKVAVTTPPAKAPPPPLPPPIVAPVTPKPVPDPVVHTPPEVTKPIAPTPPQAPATSGPQVRMGLLTEAAESALKVGDRFKECETCPEMVVIPTGEFIMGSTESQVGHERDEAPAHKVAITTRVAVARYPATVADFDTFVTVTGYRPGPGCRVFEGGRWIERSELSFRNPGFKQAADHPVVCVNWNDAKAYTDWMTARLGGTYRLPTEAEREYATRAGSTSLFWWGNEIAPSKAAYDWSVAFGSGPRGEALRGTMRVASFDPNPWGLYQMHGNVSEWVEDCWNESYRAAPADGSAWQTGDCRRRVLRGGSWGYSPKDLRAAYREGATMTFRNFNFGFRVVRVLRPSR